MSRKSLKTLLAGGVLAGVVLVEEDMATAVTGYRISDGVVVYLFRLLDVVNYGQWISGTATGSLRAYRSNLATVSCYSY